jgi:hypothetical protein
VGNVVVVAVVTVVVVVMVVAVTELTVVSVPVVAVVVHVPQSAGQTLPNSWHSVSNASFLMTAHGSGGSCTPLHSAGHRLHVARHFAPIVAIHAT